MPRRRAARSAAVVLVLAFTVLSGCNGGGDGKRGDTSDPAAAVDAFFQAIAEGDVDALIAAIDPTYMDEFEDEYGQESRSLLEGFFFATNPEGLEITGLEFEVEEDGDEAVVSVVAGTITYLDANGEKVTEDVKENVITDFETVKADGKWYVSMSTFPDWWYYLNASTGNGDGDGGGNLLYLKSDALGVSIGYPQWWDAQELAEGVVELRPVGDEERVTVTLTSMEASGTEPDYEQWIAAQVDTFDSLGWEYEYAYTDFGGYPAVEFEYSYIGEGQVPFSGLDIYAEVNGRGYMLTYLAVSDAYETYIDDVRTIIGSFETD
jgi:hypothetical protein